VISSIGAKSYNLTANTPVAPGISNFAGQCQLIILLLYIIMAFSSFLSRPEDQTYVVHPGNSPGTCCTFELASPARSKTIPYAYLQMIDTLDEHRILLRYAFADVELITTRTFSAKRQFLDDLANFRVATIRETSQMKVRILLEPPTDKTESF